MILRRHSSSTAPTTTPASRSLASVSRSRVKFVPTAAARPATSRAATVACSRRSRSTAVRSPSGAGVLPRSILPRTASTMYNGKPPVVAWSRLVSASPRGRPEIASARRAVSATSNGLRESSVSSPVARILTVQSTSSGSSSRLSLRSVPATRTGAPGTSPRQNARNASVSWSHHCTLSRTSSIGRPTASSARARPSKKRWRCQASTIALAPAPRSPRLPDGTSLSTSARHAGSSVAVADWTAGFRTHSATGASAADQRRARAASGGGPPQILKQTQLRRPADEPCCGEPGATDSRLGRRKPRACRIYLGHQALERLPRRRARNDGELTLQDRSAMVVGAHRTGPVAQVGLQQHQGAIAGLLQRLQLDPAAGGSHRSGQVAPSRSRRTEKIAQVHALALKLRPGVVHPVVVHAWQELAAVLRNGTGGVREDPLAVTGRRCRQGSIPLDVEDAHVDATRLAVVPAQTPGRHHESRLIYKNVTQVMQLPAQVGQRLCVRRIRPEQSGDALPRLGGSGMDSQKGDQGDRPRRTYPDAAGPVVGDCLLPQQSHVQHFDAAS